MTFLNSLFGSPRREPPSVLQDAEDEAALAATRRALLRSGAGSHFDPNAVDAYLSKGE